VSVLRISPMPFRDPILEGQFLADFRSAALNVTAYACISMAAMFAAFLWVAVRTEVYTQEAVFLRIFLVLFLTGAALVFLFCREFSRQRYVLLAGLTSFVALSATVAMPHLPSSGVPPVPHVASPAIVFGLFMLYAFLRMPFWVTSLVGCTIGVLAGMLVPAVVGGNELARGMVYLVFANLAGMCLCRSVELRERVLFQQRIDLEIARSEARARAASAEEANREKARLVSAISHDLRQPMAAAVAYLDLLRTGVSQNDRDKALSHVERASEAVESLGATLDHLLMAAQYDGGHEIIRCGSVNACVLVQRIRDMFAVLASDAGIRVRARVPRDAVFVSTDAIAIHRVLTNLVGNAIKYTPAGKSVLIAVRRQGSKIRIDVVDTGVGISPGHIDSIWKPFLQIDNPQRSRERGLGLGLFLVHRIVQQLPEHTVSVRSVVGRGSSFRLTLPKCQDVELSSDMSLASQHLPPVAPDLQVLVGAYVMLVEDDAGARRAFAELMEGWGVLVVSGATADEALDCDRQSDRIVDAIVLDYRLPGYETGSDAIERISRGLGYAAPTIVISGESDTDQVAADVPCGIAVLQKPFRSFELASRLIDAVALSKRHHSV
jgi:signal transduction histidine kinase/CheY-like chemotaxis protein